jgi:hypothetical protein
MSPRKPKQEENDEVNCPKCGSPSKNLIECPDCGKMGCDELCNVLGQGRPCLDCEQSQTS